MRQEYQLDFLQHILNQFDGLGSITEHRLFTTGFENTNYFVHTDRGKYAIKIFEGVHLRPDTINFEITVMNACWQAGLKTPHLIASHNGDCLLTFQCKRVIVMDYIEGKNMATMPLTDTIVYQVGQETGKMDNVL